MRAPASFDDITVDSLRRAGGLKWDRFPDAIGAWIAEMDFGVAPPITAALRDWLDGGPFGYLPDRIDTQLRAVTSHWWESQTGMHVPPSHVVPLPDVLRGFEIAMEHFSPPGSKIILPTPAYMPFRLVPAQFRREIIEVPMRRDEAGWSYDLQAIDAAFAAGGRLLVVCNPHNPIGKVCTAEELRALAQVVDRWGGRVFADEIHAPLVFPGARHVPYASVGPVAAGHAVTAVSASKAWNLPGLKCAQLLLSNAADRERFDLLGRFVASGTANPGAIATIAAYTEGGPWLADVVAYLDGNRHFLAQQLAQHLPQVRYLVPNGTYLAWLDCSALDLRGDLSEFFRTRAGVALVNGAECGGTDAVRFNFALPRPLIAQAVAAMAGAIR